MIFALKLKTGELVPSTISSSKSGCWGNSFSIVSWREGEEWGRRYWKRWDASLKSAKRLGYKIVEVELKEKK